MNRHWAAPLIGLCLLALSTPAQATTGLEWRLDDASVTYLVEAQVFLPEVMWFKAEKNLELRVALFDVQALVTCAPDEVIGKRGWELRCEVDDIALAAQAMDKEREGDLLTILDELDERYLGSWGQVGFTRDGRIRDVDLEGVDERSPRLVEIQEVMRLLLVRALAPLDLQLPKNGDDKGKGSWKQSESTAMGFPSSLGTQGASRLVHEIVGTEGDVIEVHTTGRGTMGSGEMILVLGQERPKALFDMTIEGTARFDLARGLLLERSYLVEGTPQASAVSADGSAGYPYIQSASLRLIELDDPTPTLGPSARLDIDAMKSASEEVEPAPEVSPAPKAKPTLEGSTAPDSPVSE